jgi:hypothetical protein
VRVPAGHYDLPEDTCALFSGKGRKQWSIDMFFVKKRPFFRKFDSMEKIGTKLLDYSAVP